MDERTASSRGLARFFPNRIVTDYLDVAAERTPDKVAVTGLDSMTGRVATLSFRQLRLMVDRIAAALAAHGVGRGDVVACQLPNWWQFVALHLACVRIGAITNPLMPIFRQRELRHMLAFAGTKVLVVPRSFRGCDYPAMIAEIRPELPALAHVLVIGGEGEDSFERRIVERRWEEEVDTAALQDIWNADRAVLLIQDEGVTWTKGSTPFLSDLADSPLVERADLRSLRIFVSSGAPIPRNLVERAARRLRVTIISAWGMSETGSVTTTVPGDSDDRIFGTDGVCLPGMEVRIVDAAGRPVGPGVEGVLQTRGIGLFQGYFRHPEPAKVFTPEGWFDTGDLATADAQGYVRITGRAKDIIIRGGENVPVVEVEQILYRHPAVRAVAIVGLPDARLGERACAFVILKEGEKLEFADMVSWLSPGTGSRGRRAAWRRTT